MKLARLAVMLLWLTFGVVIVLVGITLLQYRLLYFPARATIPAMVSDRLRPWPSEQDFRGLVAEPAGAVRATAIVFHGNAGHAGHRAFYADMLAPLGLRVILAEYPGYGPRDGELGERSLVADAAQNIALARRQHGEPLLVIGESLGSGVAAAAVAHDPQPVTALWMITPWDRLAHVAAHHYPWLPVRWMLRDPYDSAMHLATFRQPVLVTVAAQDTVVPAQFGIALHDSLPGPKSLSALNDAGHNDWVARVDMRWWRDALAFLLGTPP